MFISFINGSQKYLRFHQMIIQLILFAILIQAYSGFNQSPVSRKQYRSKHLFKDLDEYLNSVYASKLNMKLSIPKAINEDTIKFNKLARKGLGLMSCIVFNKLLNTRNTFISKQLDYGDSVHTNLGYSTVNPGSGIINIVDNPSADELHRLNVNSWSIWVYQGKEIPYYYDEEKSISYMLKKNQLVISSIAHLGCTCKVCKC